MKGKALFLASKFAAMFSKDKGLVHNYDPIPQTSELSLGITVGGNSEYHPRKHTVMSYAQQNRNAKKSRKAKAKASKRNSRNDGKGGFGFLIV